MSGDILGAIDRVLDDYTVGPDAMRWVPDGTPCIPLQSSRTSRTYTALMAADHPEKGHVVSHWASEIMVPRMLKVTASTFCNPSDPTDVRFRVDVLRVRCLMWRGYTWRVWATDDAPAEDVIDLIVRLHPDDLDACRSRLAW